MDGIPILVDTEYNKTVPGIIRANIIREYTEYRSKADTPLVWQTALGSLCDSAKPRIIAVYMWVLVKLLDNTKNR